MVSLPIIYNKDSRYFLYYRRHLKWLEGDTSHNDRLYALQL